MTLDELLTFQKEEMPTYRMLAKHIYMCITLDSKLQDVTENLKSYEWNWPGEMQDESIRPKDQLKLTIDYGVTGIEVKAFAGKVLIADAESWNNEYPDMLSMGKLLGAIRYYFNACIDENWTTIFKEGSVLV